MQSTRRNDLVYALLLIAAFCAFALSGLAAEAWQLAALPLATLGLGLVLRAPALFLSGSTLAVLAVIAVYLVLAARLGREGGLVWIGLYFSAPVMLPAIAVTLWLLRHRIRASRPWIVAGLGFVGTLLGFMLGQMVICNSLMYCGVLTLG